MQAVGRSTAAPSDDARCSKADLVVASEYATSGVQVGPAVQVLEQSLGLAAERRRRAAGDQPRHDREARGAPRDAGVLALGSHLLRTPVPK